MHSLASGGVEANVVALAERELNERQQLQFEIAQNAGEYLATFPAFAQGILRLNCLPGDKHSLMEPGNPLRVFRTFQVHPQGCCHVRWRGISEVCKHLYRAS